MLAGYNFLEEWSQASAELCNYSSYKCHYFCSICSELLCKKQQRYHRALEITESEDASISDLKAWLGLLFFVPLYINILVIVKCGNKGEDTEEK